LAEVIKADWSEIKGEVKELLKDYEVAPEYVELVISEVRKKVRSKLQGLPNEDWLTEILSKLYIRIAYGLLHT
jgi:signal recognition particle GTPase